MSNPQTIAHVDTVTGALNTETQDAVDARIEARRPEINFAEYYDSSIGTFYDSAFAALATDTAALTNGATVRFPPGIFRFRDAPLAINREGMQIVGAGRRSTWLQFWGAGSAIAKPATLGVLRHLGLRDFTLDVSHATAGVVGLDIDNWYKARLSEIEIFSGSVASTGIRLRGGVGKNTYYNTFTNVDVNANTCCVDIGELCNATKFIGGVYEGTGSAILAGLTGSFVDTCRWIGTEMQTTGATLIQLGGEPGGGQARDCTFLDCRFETYPNPTQIICKAGTSARNLFICNTIGVTDGIGTTFVFEDAIGRNQVFEPDGMTCLLEVGDDAATQYFSIGHIGTELMRVDHNGVGFHGVTPPVRQTVPAAATDAATTQALVNSLRSALIAWGIAQ